MRPAQSIIIRPLQTIANLLAALREGDFSEAKQYEHAPRNVAEAKAQYDEILELAGDITANFVAPRAKQVDQEGNQLPAGHGFCPLEQ